jgi:hypothetical protein
MSQSTQTTGVQALRWKLPVGVLNPVHNDLVVTKIMQFFKRSIGIIKRTGLAERPLRLLKTGNIILKKFPVNDLA